MCRRCGRCGRRAAAALAVLVLALALAAADRERPRRAESESPLVSPVPFVMGSRYGRSPERVMAPRNDRFFMGSRYGKRSGAGGGPEGGRWCRLLCRLLAPDHNLRFNSVVGAGRL